MSWTHPEVAVAVTLGLLFVVTPFFLPHTNWEERISVAFIGNSMIYYNDLPRFMEAISNGYISQNSCLHADATLTSLLYTGNGMLGYWNSSRAVISTRDYTNTTIYDFGACTIPQLLFGQDDGLEGDYEAAGYVNDGTNPCLNDATYDAFLRDQYQRKVGATQWDYIVMNDNTMGPPRFTSRMKTMKALNSTHVDWIRESGATPVFLHTHAYWNENRNMGGMQNVSVFTSLAYEGYKQYAALLADGLPTSQTPRIAPVGIAFLTVWEEKGELWERLFHSDHKHASPIGTFLQGCVVYGTLFGRMPAKQYALPTESMTFLWRRARMMAPPRFKQNPFPTREEAIYLYDVAERVVKYGHRPESFINYQNGEAAYYDEELGNYRIIYDDELGA